ncbi:MAG: His/Gly/Thr/Pro-type tRNA ligase C-terminal domain-containing protein [Candidatus Falkowbacteria bacterium]|nr:His/Gly/Thr/Pro-type tRNA ligase C-terminal domain-containing protein [Candidatus Falkowbacteria bacterium]
MKQSILFTKTTKEIPHDETSTNAQLLLRAGFINKLSAGIFTFLPMGLKVHEKICNIVREEINLIGGQEILMPALTPKDIWEKTGRWDSFDALFKLEGGDEKEYALGASHEEIVTPLIKQFVNSYKDLPIAVYQIQTKFRNELRPKAGLLRGREFSMKDLYSFHKDEADLDAFYEKAVVAYKNIYKRLGIGDSTFLTYASGGAFSKASDEFQTLTEAGEDVIHICEACRIAINSEIKDEKAVCPKCGNVKLTEKKAVEVGNIFKLGTRFSEAFDFEYIDESGAKQPIIMGCYGFGPSRVMGTLVEVLHDDRGIIWPEEVAPFKVHLLELNSADSEVKTKTTELYEALLKANVEVLYDDREKTAGEKFAEADLIGCPWRIVVSEKTLKENKVELKARSSEKFELIDFKEVVSKLK